MVLTSTVSVNYENELKTFTKLHIFAFETVTLFFQKHLEVMFLKFDTQLIQQILEFVQLGIAEA
jgi:hypothetical protein